MTKHSSDSRKFWHPAQEHLLPQAHSRDGYLRLCAGELASLDWTLVHFLEDAPWGCRRCGCTEWCAAKNGLLFSLGWDWFQVRGQGARVDVLAGIRTNIQIRDRQGYDLPLPASQSHLLSTISQLPWLPLP
jgi:hypothetical protein